MSFKINLIKSAIRLSLKLTPKKMILWVANIKLKGIAELMDFSFDIDARTVYYQIKLVGETESIQVWLDDFAIISHDKSYQVIIQSARSNKPWLTNILALVTAKAWDIPPLPQLAKQIELAAELFKAGNLVQETKLIKHD